LIVRSTSGWTFPDRLRNGVSGVTPPGRDLAIVATALESSGASTGTVGAVAIDDYRRPLGADIRLAGRSFL
jgi:hypothetical protein